MSTLTKRLKEARKQAKLSQEKLGFLVGIDEVSASSRMNQYEKGKHVPHISFVERLAGVLNLPTAYFYAEDDDLAALLITFHRLRQSDKKKILSFVEGLKK